MLEKLVSLAVRRWALVLVSTLAFSALAWVRFRSLPIEAFPDVTDPMVEVVGLYPGQAAEEVERRVAIELERVLSGTPHMATLRSVSVFGLTLLTLTFEEGTKDFEMRTLVAERLANAALPAGAETLLGPQATPVGQIFRYTVRGPKSLKDLRALQDFTIERRLRAVPGVADVVTFGGFERQFQVRIDPVRMAASGVSFAQVYTALSRTNENAGGGYISVGSQELVVRGLGAAREPIELGLAVVNVHDGVPIRVRDVADLVDGSTPRRGAVGRGRLDEVVEGIVLLRRGENPSEVLESLRRRVDELNETVLPRGVRIDTFYDRTTLVSATLRTVGKNMLEGVLLVLAVVYTFLRSWRAVLIVALIIPVSLLSAFLGLSSIGLPANLISLGAIDFGILVDGAILVVEATLHALEHAQGSAEERRLVLTRAPASVAKAVGFSMLIIVVALGPIFGLERVEGRIFAPMAFTYAFALLGALGGALLLVPALQVGLFRGAPVVRSPAWLTRAAGAYARWLAKLRDQRLVVLAAFGLGFAGLVGSASHIGNEFLPELNEGGFYVTAVFPSTISLDETRLRVREIRERILRTTEVRDVLSHVGRPESATQAEGPNNAEFFVVLAPEEEWGRGRTRRDLEAEFRGRLGEIPGVQYNFSQPITDRVFETISGIIGQVVVKVRGSDLGQMTEVAERIQKRLANVEGVTDLALYQAGSVPTLSIRIDRESLARRGLSVDDIQSTIRIALGGEVATDFWQNEQRFAVALRLPDEIRTNPDALGRLTVGEPSAHVTLGEVASIEPGVGRAAIWREDFSRFVALKFNVRGRDLGGTVAEAQARVANLELPEGTYTSWGGEFQNQQRAMKRLSLTLPLALLGVIALLFASFGRLRPTLCILLLLPAAIAGAVSGLHLTGENFSVSSAVGCVALVGQVVLAGATLCACIDRALAAGHEDPLIHGAKEAFRPVLLTTLLALLGLLPAALSHSMGSETQRPFAIAVVTGLLAAVPAVLVLLPLLYRGTRPASRAVGNGPVSTKAPGPSAGSEPRHALHPLLIVLVLLALPGRSMAQSAALESAVLQPAVAPLASSSVTFDRAQAEAALRRGHPRLASARSTEAAASKDTAAAGLWSNPELSVDYVQGLTQSSYDPFGVAVVGVSQFVELAGVPAARRQVARDLEAVATSEREALEIGLFLSLRKSYVALSSQYRIVTSLEEFVDHLANAERVMTARVAAGTSSGLGARRIVVARAEAEAELGMARAEYARLRGEFDVAVGPEAAMLQGWPVFEEVPSFELSARDAAIARTLDEQRGLATVRAAERARSAEIAVAKKSVFPGVRLRIFGGYGQATGQWDLGAGVALPLPLVDRGQSQIPAAEARARAARELTDASTLEARQRVTAAHAAAERTLEALAHFVSQTEGADAGLTREAAAQFREGRLSVLELVDGLSTVQHLTARRVQLMRDAQLALLELERLVRVGAGAGAGDL